MNPRYQLRNVSVPLVAQPDPFTALIEKLRIARERVESWEIVRKAIDARQKQRVHFVYTLLVSFHGDIPPHPDLTPYTPPHDFATPEPIKLSDPHPYIIGMGPAGLFAALALVENGLAPILFERGDSLEARQATVGRFWGTGLLDPESNVQFGEGGAGAFSDGKLTARNHTPSTDRVFDYLIQFGAPPEIAYEALPHLGTDGLAGILQAMRTYLQDHGVEFRFRSRLDGLTLERGRVRELRIAGEVHRPEVVVLGIGNGARDTFHQLHDAGVLIEAKPFAVGMRIEHRQDFLNAAFYGENTDISLTGPATYRLTAKVSGKGVYSFCMCPGGLVVAAASEEGGQVLNGMSHRARDGVFGNSAIVATVDMHDFGRHPMDGLNYQRSIEQACFDGIHPYHAPAQAAVNFLYRRHQALHKCSYRPGILARDLEKLFPAPLIRAIKQGLAHFDRQVPGFVENGQLLAPETRTSCPVRMVRREDSLCSMTAENLFPVGEGAGYAGGIISSAADGYRTGAHFFI